MSDNAVDGIGKSSSNVYHSLHGALPINLGEQQGVMSTLTSSYNSFNNAISQLLYSLAAGDTMDRFQPGVASSQVPVMNSCHGMDVWGIVLHNPILAGRRNLIGPL